MLATKQAIHNIYEKEFREEWREIVGCIKAPSPETIKKFQIGTVLNSDIALALLISVIQADSLYLRIC